MVRDRSSIHQEYTFHNTRKYCHCRSTSRGKLDQTSYDDSGYHGLARRRNGNNIHNVSFHDMKIKIILLPYLNFLNLVDLYAIRGRSKDSKDFVSYLLIEELTPPTIRVHQIYADIDGEGLHCQFQERLISTSYRFERWLLPIETVLVTLRVSSN